jgi:hypothetical protein
MGRKARATSSLGACRCPRNVELRNIRLLHAEAIGDLHLCELAGFAQLLKRLILLHEFGTPSVDFAATLRPVSCIVKTPLQLSFHNRLLLAIKKPWVFRNEFRRQKNGPQLGAGKTDGSRRTHLGGKNFRDNMWQRRDRPIMLLGRRRLQLVQEVGGALRVGGSVKDRALVVSEGG